MTVRRIEGRAFGLFAQIFRGLLAGPVAGIAAWLVAAADARAEDPDFFAVSVSYFDFNQQDDEAAAVNFEYRSDFELWIFKPFAGAMVTTDGAVYGYGGLLFDLYFGKEKRIVLTPSAAVGAYEEGDGKDLGNTLEFRTGAEIAYRFADRSRLGIGFWHISNAGAGDDNPGTEIIGLTYARPLGGLF